MNVDVMTAPTPGRTKDTVTTYAKSASVRYLKILKIVEYEVNSCSARMSAAMGNRNTDALTCPTLRSDAPAATAPRSAPRLIMLATHSAMTAMLTIHVGNFRRSAVPSPVPVCSAMRAHSSCTALISGNVNSAVHSSP